MNSTPDPIRIEDFDPKILAELQEKVRVSLLYGTCPGISLSNDANKWGRTLKVKPIFPAEARMLADILRLCADEAEKNAAADKAERETGAHP